MSLETFNYTFAKISNKISLTPNCTAIFITTFYIFIFKYLYIICVKCYAGKNNENNQQFLNKTDMEWFHTDT